MIRVSTDTYKVKGISLALVGDEAIYADGSTAKIISGAGNTITVHDRSAALVGLPLENGDEIIDSPITSHVLRLYLNMLLEDNDPTELAHALGVNAKARGMTQIAKEAGIGREALYKALRHDSAPGFDTINRVVNTLGLKLTAQNV